MIAFTETDYYIYEDYQLINRKMSVAALRKEAEIAPNRITRMRKEQEVTLSVLGRICEVLNVDFGDIVEYVRENERDN